MIKNYINGKITDLGTSGYFSKINPSTEENIAQIVCTNINGVNYAVDSARIAFNSWRKLSRIKRGEYFDNLAQLIKRDKKELSKIISLETGKNLNEAEAEVNETLHCVQYCAGLSRMPSGEILDSEISDKKIFVERFPKGVVLVISPFNFPFALPHWSSAPALLEGNTVIIKPSELAPVIAEKMAALYHEAGFPDGTINVIHGDKHTSSLLTEHEDINCILFTGSFNVGQQIKEACVKHWNKSVHLELGSKTSIIINKDFSVEKAVDLCIPSAFKLAGQRCVSASRLIVHKDILNEFAGLFVDKARHLKIGDPLSEMDSYFGPVINYHSVVKTLDFNEKTRKDSEVLLNGYRLDRKGYFLSPHIYLTGWNNKKSYLVEECFAPHCAIIPFSSIDEAIFINNDVDYGLAMSVLTNDYKIAKHVQMNANYGVGYHNAGCIGSESHVGFTGTRKSGNCSSAAGTIDSVTVKKSWTVNYSENFQFAQGMT